jgi:hypothetical protein
MADTQNDISTSELKSRVKTGLEDLAINVRNYIGLSRKKYELLAEVDKSLTDLRTRVTTIFGSLNYKGAYDFKVATPTQDTLSKYITDNYEGAIPVKGDTIINLFNSNEWWYNGVSENPSWINIGNASITFADNDSPGIVQGSTSKFHVFIDANGKMIVNGLGTLEEVVFDIDNKLNNLIHDINVSLGAINEMLTSSYINDFGVDSIMPQLIDGYAKINNRQIITIKSTMTNPKNLVVALDGKTNTIAATNPGVGVIEEDYNTNQNMRVVTKGIVKIKCNAAGIFTKGNLAYQNYSNGKIIGGNTSTPSVATRWTVYPILVNETITTTAADQLVECIII